MRVYLFVLVVSALVTYLVTPAVRVLAQRVGAMTPVRERDVHTTPTPRLGGLAMYGGFALAIILASQTPFLQPVFADSSAVWGIVVAAGLVCLLGIADDIWELDALTKFVGQVLAAGYLAWKGVQLTTLPVGGVTVVSARLSLVFTVLAVVTAINAVNFVDGLDGLAAGIAMIGGSAFFIYSYLLTRDASPGDFSSLASLVVAALVGCCLGFLPHNFHPARIFMGDSGAMFLGLTLAASTVTVTGQVNPNVVSRAELFPAFVPILVPIAVLLVPLADLLISVVRRVSKGRSPFHADRMHLHHRLLELGHSHRGAVVIMYLWTAVWAFGAALLVLMPPSQAIWIWVLAFILALLLTLGPLRSLLRRPARVKASAKEKTKT